MKAPEKGDTRGRVRRFHAQRPYGDQMPREPAHVRPRRRTLLVVSVLAASAMVGPAGTEQLAQADDRLHRRQDDTASRLQGARRDYDTASRALLQAHRSLQLARSQLAMARATLETRRAELVATQVAHRQAQDDLVFANRRVDDARSRLREGRERRDGLQAQWKQQVVSEFESGGAQLAALSTMLDDTDPADLMDRLAGLDAVNDSYDATLSRAAASVTLMNLYEKELSAARADVRIRVDESRQRLEDVASAEVQAERARERVSGLVARRGRAAAAAATVRAREAAQVRRLQVEQARIQRMLRRRAAAAEAKAAKNAAAHRDPVGGKGWTWPTPGWVSTPYGWRTHPIYGYRSFHNGIDIAAACGTPVRAPLGGEVLSAYYQSAYGKRVLIDHGAPSGVGTATEYNHLQSWVVGPGDRVARGQVVGFVGNTGWSTGCHLHFTIYRSGRPVDPVPLLR